MTNERLHQLETEIRIEWQWMHEPKEQPNDVHQHQLQDEEVRTSDFGEV